MRTNLMTVSVGLLLISCVLQTNQDCDSQNGHLRLYKKRIAVNIFVLLMSPNPEGTVWEVKDLGSNVSYKSCSDHRGQVGSGHLISVVNPTGWQAAFVNDQQILYIYNQSYLVSAIEELSCEPGDPCCAFDIMPTAMCTPCTMPPNATKCPEPNCNGWCDAATGLLVVVLFETPILAALAVIFFILWRKNSTRESGTWQSESLQNYLRDSFEKRIDFHMVKLEYAGGTFQLRAGQFLYKHSLKSKLVSILVYTEEVPPGVIQSLGESFVFLVSETDCRGPLTVLPALSAQDGQIHDLTAHLRSCIEMERVQEESANRLRSRVETLTEENAALEAHLRSCMETKRLQEESASQLRSRVETLTEENAALESEKENFIANVNNYASENSRLIASNAELKERISELNTELKRVKDSEMAEINKLEDEKTKTSKLESQMQVLLEDLRKSEDEQRGSVNRQFKGESTGPQIVPVSQTRQVSGTFEMVLPMANPETCD